VREREKIEFAKGRKERRILRNEGRKEGYKEVHTRGDDSIGQ
jgi:hypothetical protein